MSDQQVTLSGLDGANPLGFIAALGLLRLLDLHALEQGIPRPRMFWSEGASWVPVVDGSGDLDTILDMVMGDLVTWHDDPAFLLAYSDDRLVDPRSETRATRDLKPLPSLMREFLVDIASTANSPEGSAVSWRRRRRSMDMAAAFGSEIVTDNNGRTKPLALHFTAGQQQFLKALAEIQERVSRDDFEEALRGPWKGESRLPSMSWDATISRIYSLRASDPSKEKRGSIPGADWLAFLGMGFLLSTPVGRKLETTGVHGGWKTSRFIWPIWSVPLPVPVVGALMAVRDPARLNADERKLRGIVSILSSGITRADQGGYGGFTPASIC